VGVEVLPALHQRVLPLLELEYLAGVGLDFVRYQPLSSLDDRVTAGAGDREIRANLVAGLRAVVGDSWLRWAVLVQCGFALSRTHYFLGAGLERRELARPSRALPLVGLEATF
jgi:hypothetical protein